MYFFLLCNFVEKKSATLKKTLLMVPLKLVYSNKADFRCLLCHPRGQSEDVL